MSDHEEIVEPVGEKSVGSRIIESLKNFLTGIKEGREFNVTRLRKNPDGTMERVKMRRRLDDTGSDN